MEIWALCETCRRWFHCPTWFDRSQPQPRCPLCNAEPTAIENRAADRRERGDAEPATGLGPLTKPARAQPRAN